MKLCYVAVLFGLVFFHCDVEHATAITYKATLLQTTGLENTVAYGAAGLSIVGGGHNSATGGPLHALLWNAANNSVVDLHPAGFDVSFAWSASESGQVGWGSGSAPDALRHALLWNGTAASVVDLHPLGFEESEANAIHGTSQAGYGSGSATGGKSHALLWTGTAESVVDLNPTGFATSFANSVWGTTQAGYGYIPAVNDNGINGMFHALLWNGSASSSIDLTPSWLGLTVAYAASEGTQGGVGLGIGTDNHDHAMLWHGSADSAVDIHPEGLDGSTIYGILGSTQVGIATRNGLNGWIHAYLWNGTAKSAVDLHSSLDALGIEFESSYAQGIAANGDIVGYAYSRDDVSNITTYAVKWSPVPVPEPSSFAILWSISGCILFRRCRKD